MNTVWKIVTDVRTILAVITLCIGIYVTDKIQSITDMLVAANSALQSIQQVIDIDPAKVTAITEKLSEGTGQVSTALSEGAEVLGEGVGDGSATVVDKVGNAWNSFKSNQATE